MFKITGLDKLSRELKEAEKAFAEIDGEIGSVNFDPKDPLSIEAAIQEMEQMVDQKVGRYSDNSIVGPMIEEVKVNYREAIIEKAAEARLQEGDL